MSLLRSFEPDDAFVILPIPFSLFTPSFPMVFLIVFFCLNAKKFKILCDDFFTIVLLFLKFFQIKFTLWGEQKEFSYIFQKVFNGPEPWIANIKLMQMYFIDKVLHLNKNKRNEFLTDLLFVSQKKGDKVFDFGPFGKLY